MHIRYYSLLLFIKYWTGSNYSAVVKRLKRYYSLSLFIKCWNGSNNSLVLQNKISMKFLRVPEIIKINNQLRPIILQLWKKVTQGNS